MIGNMLAYEMFVDPLAIWARPWIWPLLILPLSLAVAVVYKSVRCRDLRTMIRESIGLFATIVAGMVVAAAALAALAKFME